MFAGGAVRSEGGTAISTTRPESATSFVSRSTSGEASSANSKSGVMRFTDILQW